jgi:hypothetical protein
MSTRLMVIELTKENEELKERIEELEEELLGNQTPEFDQVSSSGGYSFKTQWEDNREVQHFLGIKKLYPNLNILKKHFDKDDVYIGLVLGEERDTYCIFIHGEPVTPRVCDQLVKILEEQNNETE